MKCPDCKSELERVAGGQTFWACPCGSDHRELITLLQEAREAAHAARGALRKCVRQLASGFGDPSSTIPRARKAIVKLDKVIRQ